MGHKVIATLIMYHQQDLRRRAPILLFVLLIARVQLPAQGYLKTLINLPVSLLQLLLQS
jgi:hypothetical protein